eukprot:403364790
MVSTNKRRDKDVMKLLVSDYDVHLTNENNMSEFVVKFNGPSESPYEGGQWKVRVILPDQYPYKSPSIGFVNRIYHPNIDEASGSVCLDVINQTWSPMFDLINIFDVFMPQLLLYPNPADPLNPEAANLYNKNFEKFKEKVREHVKKYATADSQDQIKSSAPAQNGQDHHQTNGAHVNGSSKNGTVDKHSDKGSELSETSDLDGLDDDEDGDGAMNLGSDDEEEKKSQ